MEELIRELRGTLGRLSAALGASTDAIVWTDWSETVRWANPAFCRLVGRPRLAVLGRPLAESLPLRRQGQPVPAHDTPTSLALRGSAFGAAVYELERDGSSWTLELVAKAVESETDDPSCICVIRDVTEREVARSLRESEARLRRILEQANDGIWEVDRQGRTTFVNRRMAEMLGHAPEDLIGQPALALVDEGDRKRATARLARRWRGIADREHATFRRKDGTVLSATVSGTPIVDELGEPVGAVSVVTDLTEQRRIEERLRFSERLASLGTLASGIAHEVNNPLSYVLANLDFLAAELRALVPEVPGERVRDLLEAAEDARDGAERVRKIVRDLRTLARADDEGTGPVDVRLVLDRAAERAANEIRHRARLVKDYGDVVAVEGNEARLGQVFLNLLINAAHAIAEGRASENEIRIVTRMAGEAVAVEVHDTGSGIPEDIRARIFEPFFTTKPVDMGTGLGLSICHGIVTSLGGTIAADSAVGKGSVFRLTLPAAPGLRPATTAVETALAGGGRILVVDDDPLVCAGLRRRLERDYEVVTSTSGREVLERLVTGERFDAVLCDLRMPDMTGMDLHEELLRVAPELAARMIFMTGGALGARAEAFLASVPNPRLDKPVDAAALAVLVERLTRSSGGP